MSGLPGIDEALALVLARVRPVGAEGLPVARALGRFLAEDARAATDLPPFRSSAMDGFAVRAADTPGALAVVGHSAAGHPSDRTLGAGEAIEISTGAVVPDGADAVVPVERTRGDVEVEAVASGENVRAQGGDVRAGDVVVPRGAKLGAPQCAALAAAGVAQVVCARRPRVVVLATGSELRAPGAALGPGEIYESNTVLLAAALADCDVEVLKPVADDEGSTRDAIARGLEADVLVTTGGVSVGPHDLVRASLTALGAEEVFWRVAVKPGKPIAFAVRDATLIFGLPGNPVSSLVGYELFVRPAVDALQGASAPRPRLHTAILGRSVRRTAQRDELVRARTRIEDDVVHVDPLDGQDSHMIARAAAADALVLVRRGDGELAAGTQVSYLSM